MPEVGDKSRADRLGHAGRATCVYVACPRCGEPKWVRAKYLREGHVGLCNKCAAQKRSEHYRGSLSARWAGGRHLHSDGYIQMVVTPDDPFYPMACRTQALEGQVASQAKEIRLLKWHITQQGNPELSSGQPDKCVETRRVAPSDEGDGMVQPSRKVRTAT